MKTSLSLYKSDENKSKSLALFIKVKNKTQNTSLAL